MIDELLNARGGYVEMSAWVNMVAVPKQADDKAAPDGGGEAAPQLGGALAVQGCEVHA
jgi:hypothetical protein